MTGADQVLLKDEKQAFELCKSAASKNLASAQFTLGIFLEVSLFILIGYFHEAGIGTAKNNDEALKYYTLAAENGTK